MQSRVPGATTIGGHRARSTLASAAPGATLISDRPARFKVWAPSASLVEVRLLTPDERIVRLSPAGGGYHEALVDEVEAGAHYFVRLDGEKERPDPASRYQPEGVHGPSEVTGPDFEWHDGSWRNLPLEDYVLYELHIGTYTPAGTFDAVVPHLRGLRHLGVTALEVMPVAQFPGTRNWGYDGAYPYAVQNSYGGPAGLRRLVDACHSAGMAFVLDVVYNHLGPEGSYLADFGPYFTDRYRTPWGAAINYDGEDSDAVREFFLENALYWVREFHVDALRLDAVHAIYDFSARHFLEELAGEVDDLAAELGRPVHLIAESGLNDPRIVRPGEIGGYAIDAQWNDDFHHALHVALTGERTGYYVDYDGVSDLATSFNQSFVYNGQYSQYRRRRFGAPADDVPVSRFVVFAQNHDQVGNRMLGERLSRPLPFEASKLAAAVVILSPFTPLLWMGEEYGEQAPFLYFVSHSDQQLVNAVREGRIDEFAEFAWQGTPPDPQAEETFLRSRLDHSLKQREPGATLLRFYRELLGLRRQHRVLGSQGRGQMTAEAIGGTSVIVVRVGPGRPGALVIHHFGPAPVDLSLPGISDSPVRWRIVIDSADVAWKGPGSLVTGIFDPSASPGVRLQPYSSIVLERVA